MDDHTEAELAKSTRGNPSPVEAATQSLIEAARAVVTRWHTPAWKEVEHTAAFIARLDEAATRAAGAAPPAQQWVPIDGEWYFVRYEGLGKTHEAPALYRGASKAFYSVEFAGIPEREVSVMWRVNHPAPAAPQHQGGGNG